MFIVHAPVFCRVIVCGVLLLEFATAPKFMGAVESDTAGGAAVPVPLRVTVSGEVVELSLTVRVPGNVPTACGEKAIPMVQLPPGARTKEVPEQVPVDML